MFKWAKEDFWLLKSSGKHIFIFELTYKLVATAFVYPLALLLINLALKVSGVRYLTNEHILKLLANPFVWLLVLFFILAFVGYCTYEMSFLSACYELKRQNCRASILETGLTALHRMKKMLHLRNIPLACFYFISILAVNVTILCNILFSENAVNLFRTYVIHGSWLFKSVLVLVLLLIYAVVIMGVYSFNIFALEGKSFRQAFAKSRRMVRRHFVGTFFSLIAYNLAVLAVIGVFYLLISLILIAGVKILDMAYMGSAVYLSILRYVRTGTKLFLIYIAIPASYTVISRMYYKYADLDKIDYVVLRIRDRYFKLNRIIYFVLLIGSMALNITYAVRSFNKNPFERIAIFHETKITAHRGASTEAPENTLAAFSKALEDMADYIELDVQMTADGEIVVMHDANAYRTTGVNRPIREMTLDEVKKLDAGSYFSKEFSGEKVPTLREVFELVKGKAMLNIEIKSSGNRTVADKVVALVQEYDAEEQCVITSFEYNILTRVKEIEPSIQVGYILSVAYGDFYSMDEVDFFSMNASFLSKRLVDAIHNSGKEVHAWTVNKETSIKNLTNKGVDNVITDNPVLARETIYSRNTSETLVNMVKYVFNR